MTATALTLRRFLPQLYRLRDTSLDWKRLVEQVIEPEINLWLGGGPDAGATDRTAISIDAMALLRDPLHTRLDALPYLAQHIGIDLDASLPEGLQRKILTLAEPLLRERGTRAGIVDGIRLLLGLEVVYRDVYGDAWQVGRDELDATTVLGPPTTTTGYSRGTLTAPAPSAIPHGSVLGFPKPGLFGYEFQREPKLGGDYAAGWLTAPDPALLANNLTITVPLVAGGDKTFELKRDASFVSVAGGSVVVDLSAATSPEDVATTLKAALDGLAGTIVPATITRQGATLSLLAGSIGTASNRPLGGTGLSLFDGIGMKGGTAGGAFTNFATAINLQGLSTATEVAQLLRHVLAFTLASEAIVDRALAKVLIRWRTQDPDADGAFTGNAAPILRASRMVGGRQVNPLILTFTVTFPRVLTAQERRAAVAVIEAMKQAPSHYRLVEPAAGPGLWRLGVSPLGSARLGQGIDPSADRGAGTYAADLFYARAGKTLILPIDATSARSIPLAVGGAYAVSCDAGCHLRQGNRQVVATTADMFLPAGSRLQPIVVTAPANQYVAVVRAVPGPASTLRITRLDA